MNFILLGFTQDAGSRVFAFQGIGVDRVKSDYTVSADLNLTRRYGIRLQELPLICRGVLERLAEGAGAQRVTLTEDGMRLHSDKCAAEKDAQKRKSPRRPSSEHMSAETRAVHA